MARRPARSHVQLAATNLDRRNGKAFLASSMEFRYFGIYRDRAQISSFTQKRACPLGTVPKFLHLPRNGHARLGGRGFEPCPYFLLKKLKIFFLRAVRIVHSRRNVPRPAEKAEL